MSMDVYHILCVFKNVNIYLQAIHGLLFSEKPRRVVRGQYEWHFAGFRERDACNLSC